MNIKFIIQVLVLDEIEYRLFVKEIRTRVHLKEASNYPIRLTAAHFMNALSAFM